ncbi:nickel/cobalt transporter [Desulfosarcina ovata]|nr:high-affinity nickel-transporter [Desulfosarcina ovata]
MRMRRIAFLMLMVAVVAVMPWGYGASSQAARNPFISSKRTNGTTESKPAVGYPALFQPAMQKIVTVQFAIRQNMVRLAGDIQQDPFGHAFRMFMLFSLLYGMVHALGPGHGKVYACAYFLNRPGTIKRGLALGCLTMLVHVLSGTVLILVGATVLKTSGAMTLENAGVVLERVSYGLLVGLGIFLAGHTLLQLRTKTVPVPQSCPGASDTRSLLVAALAVGIVPCPGAAMILLFSLTLGILPAGLGAMICIAAGMSLTTGVFAVLTIVLKQRFLGLVEGNRRLFSLAYAILALGGAAGITILGMVLFIGSVN